MTSGRSGTSFERSDGRGRVLLIDDSEHILHSAKEHLQAAGYAVVTTNQIVGAGRFLKDCELVLIDYHMPGLDGPGVLQSLRAAAEAAKLKPLFFLYTTDGKKAEQARQLGFDGSFVRKGEPEQLVAQVDKAMRLAKLTRLKDSKGS